MCYRQDRKLYTVCVLGCLILALLLVLTPRDVLADSKPTSCVSKVTFSILDVDDIGEDRLVKEEEVVLTPHSANASVVLAYGKIGDSSHSEVSDIDSDKDISNTADVDLDEGISNNETIETDGTTTNKDKNKGVINNNAKKHKIASKIVPNTSDTLMCGGICLVVFCIGWFLIRRGRIRKEALIALGFIALCLIGKPVAYADRPTMNIGDDFVVEANVNSEFKYSNVPNVKGYEYIGYCVVSNPEAKNYKVVFDFDCDELDNIEYSLLEGSETPKVEVPDRVGYEFSGWNKDIDEYVLGDNVYVACWTPNTYKVIFNIGNVPLIFDDLSYGYEFKQLDKLLESKCPENMVISDWDKPIEYVVTQNNEYNAILKPRGLNVVYRLNNGQDDIVCDAEYGQDTPRIDDPVYKGHEFIGWCPSIKEKVDGNIVYEAMWDEDTYCVGYKTKNDSEYYYGLKPGTSTPEFSGDIEVAGYNFVGWDKDVATTVNSDVEYHAIYEPKVYTITYKVSDQIKEFKVPYLSATPRLDKDEIDHMLGEYELFDGWNTSPDLYVTQDKVYEAKTVSKQFNTTYVLNNGEPNVVMATNYNDLTPCCDIPIKEGYRFVKWSPQRDKRVTENKIYSAVWVPNTHKVMFDAPFTSNFEEVQEVEHNTCAIRPPDPSFAGGKFLGWYTDKARTHKFDFKTKIVKDTVLYPKMERDFVLVVYDYGYYNCAVRLRRGERAPCLILPSGRDIAFAWWFETNYLNNDEEPFDFNKPIYHDTFLKVHIVPMMK